MLKPGPSSNATSNVTLLLIIAALTTLQKNKVKDVQNKFVY